MGVVQCLRHGTTAFEADLTLGARAAGQIDGGMRVKDLTTLLAEAVGC
jgi:hypothetical protein